MYPYSSSVPSWQVKEDYSATSRADHSSRGVLQSAVCLSVRSLEREERICRNIEVCLGKLQLGM
jgi:hypothetical protein